MTDDSKNGLSADATVELGTDVQELLARMAGERVATRCLVVIGGMDVGSVVPLTLPSMIAGRDTDCDVVLTDAGTSRRHALFEREGDDYTITDLESRNGVFVNGAPVQKILLKDGDKILLGLFTVFKYSEQDELELEYSQRVRESLSVDSLTGVLNRRALDERLSAEWSYAARHKTPLSVLMLDVDHFKKVNDTWGHGVGDDVLRAVSKALAGGLRTEDEIGRYGGEEFIVIARGIANEGAMLLAERLRKLVEAVRVEHQTGPIRVTISIGVATASGGYAASSDVLVAMADKRLYEAKNGGRNRSVGE